MAKQNKIGKLGERVAYVYLKNKGYTLVACNVYGTHGEIDLVVVKNDILVCVEVKTTASRYNKSPETAVNSQKRQSIVSTFYEKIGYFESKASYSEVYFDVISITLDTKIKKAHVRHYKNLLVE